MQSQEITGLLRYLPVFLLLVKSFQSSPKKLRDCYLVEKAEII